MGKIRRATRKRRIFLEERYGHVSLLEALDSPYARLLAAIIQNMDRHSNQYHSTGKNKDLIMEKLDIPEVSYHRQLKWLTEKKIIERYSRGIYGLNRNMINFE